MSGRRLRTVVADTSALVSLAVPRADAAVDIDTPDPFQYLLTSCEVFVPLEVVAELHDITQYQEIHAAAANNVLTATTRSRIPTNATKHLIPGRRSVLMLAKPTALSSQICSMSTDFSQTSLAGQTFHSSMPCYRGHGSSQHLASSSTTLETGT